MNLPACVPLPLSALSTFSLSAHAPHEISFILALSQLFSRTICMRICRCLFAQKLCPVRLLSHCPAVSLLSVSLPVACASVCPPSYGFMRVPFTARLPLGSWPPALQPRMTLWAMLLLLLLLLLLRLRLGLFVQFFFHFLCAVNNFCSVYFFRVGRRRRRCFFQTLIVVACPFAQHSSTASLPASSSSSSALFSSSSSSLCT